MLDVAGEAATSIPQALLLVRELSGYMHGSPLDLARFGCAAGVSCLHKILQLLSRSGMPSRLVGVGEGIRLGTRLTNFTGEDVNSSKGDPKPVLD